MEKQFDDQTYHIGQTEIPKSRKGKLSVLLIVIIMLCGFVSILGLMNISLFQKLLSMDETDQPVAEAVRDESNNPSALDIAYEGETIVLEYSPQSWEYFPRGGALSLQNIYSSTVHSIVTVESGNTNGIGIVVARHGYILTNSYLLNGSEKINIRLANGQKLPAMVVGRDNFSDLAILRVEEDNLIPVKFGDSSALRVGDIVVAMGSVNGTAALADGVVSAIQEDIQAGGDTITLIRTSALLEQEQLGGVLLNCYGQVVGVSTYCAANMMNMQDTEKTSYVLDSVTVKNISNQLISHGFVEGRIHLGIHGQEIDAFYQQYYDIPMGIFITSIEENCELYRRGVREGDILIELDNTAVHNFDTLNSLLESIPSGEEVTAVVYRDGTQYQMKVRIGEAP